MLNRPLLGSGLVAAALVLSILIGRGSNDEAGAQSLAEAGDTTRIDRAARIRSDIQNDPVAPTVAPKGADVTIVIFSDYQCPYCRKFHAVVEQLRRDDPKVRLVYRDWPIFGPASTEAARAAIAARYQGRHGRFNESLMRTQGKLTSASIRTAASRAGVDWRRLQNDLKTHAAEIDATLDRTRRYAAMLGLSGTPSLLVDSYLIPGGVDLPNLKRAVAMARQAKGSSGPARR